MPITPAVVVTAEDSNANTVTSFTGGITVAIGSGPGTLSGTTTQNAVNGAATFGDLSINQIASGYTLTRVRPAGGVPSATSTAFNISTYPTYPVTFTGQPRAVAFDGTYIWVAGLGGVVKLSPSTGAVVGTYVAGVYPVALAFDGTNMWVGNDGDGTVTELSASTGAVLATYTGFSRPDSLVSDGTNIWVGNYGDGTVTKLFASTGAVLGTYATGATIHGMAFDGTNVWVATGGNFNGVFELQASTISLVNSIDLGGFGGNEFGIAFDGTNIWVAANYGAAVVKLLASSGAVVGSYATGTYPIGVAFDGTYIWVANSGNGGSGGNTVTKLLASSGALVGTYPVGNFPWGLAFDGTNMWVANAADATVTEIVATP